MLGAIAGFLELLLCMMAGHVIIGNPSLGAATFLAARILSSWYLGGLGRLRHVQGSRYLSRLIPALALLAALAIMLLYPVWTGETRAGLVSFISAALVLADYLVRSRSIRTQIISSNQTISYESVGSYRIFTNMTLYVTLALYLSMMAMFCKMLIEGGSSFHIEVYAGILLWCFFAMGAVFLSSRLVRKWYLESELTVFVVGVFISIPGVILMFRSWTFIGRTVWSLVWCLGLALISASITQFNRDFEAVGSLTDGGLSRKQLEESNAVTSAVSTIISDVVLLVMMAVWTFVLPVMPDHEAPEVFVLIATLLPILCLIAAIVFALFQPLDRRNREKLMHFIDGSQSGEPVKENLHTLLVRKYRVRARIRILCILIAPLLRLRLSGKKNLNSSEYPSIFVCNHGFIYGPVSAIIYMPTYFRPWIHDEMLDFEKAYTNMSFSFQNVKKVLGNRLGGAIIRAVARVVHGVLRALNPIPVARGDAPPRARMETFETSLQALMEGDNILIFPEKPGNLTIDGKDSGTQTADLRNFYTGFVHIAKMYHDRCGKSLRFYPIYSDKTTRRFRIGEPVCYDPSLPPKEAKVRVAETLHERMSALAAGEK